MKEWWQQFFVPVTGEVMFKPRTAQAKKEVQQVLKQIRVSTKSKILDLACGTGRHSLQFAKKKHHVVGFDFTKNFLEEARKEAKKQKLEIDFVRGDMKYLRPHFEPNQFDLVVSLFNSFGYFKIRSHDLKMLQEVYRVLKPGGRLVINTLNGKGVKMAMKRPISFGREPIKNVFMLDQARFDEKKMKTFSEWTIIDTRRSKTKVHRLKFHQNVYTHRQLKTLLKKAGFKIEKVWGMLGGGALDPKTTWHQTIVARK